MAKEYIEREYLVKEAEAVLDFRKKHYTDKARIADAASTVEWLKYYAPAADVVEVVRCKDCIKRKTQDCSMYYEADGEQYSWEVDDDFCSQGERRCNNAAD